MKKEIYNTIEQREEGSFFVGLAWGTLLSIPLWLSFFGWIKLIRSLI